MDGNGISTLFVPLPPPSGQAPMPIVEVTPPRPVEAAERPASDEKRNGAETKDLKQEADSDARRAAVEGKGLRLDRRV